MNNFESILKKYVCRELEEFSVEVQQNVVFVYFREEMAEFHRNGFIKVSELGTSNYMEFDDVEEALEFLVS